ncbi:MAG: DUF1028 domain-containing protein [archaeon GB-1867-035]|nr:DUF1028 domain-containing protein [Candidatus Culexmicrobium profundum]
MTFSIVAISPREKELGVAVSTAVPCVGARVPHVEMNVGAIATQARTNIWIGIKGLKMLKLGLSPQTVLDALLREDPLREERQAAIIDIYGRKAVFTGSKTIDWKGHIIGKNYIVIGNLLVGRQVLESMSKAFEKSNGSLAERLLLALKAGDDAGGDRRGKCSAALLVAGPKYVEEYKSPAVSMRVDYHEEPVIELIKIYNRLKEIRMKARSTR